MPSFHIRPFVRQIKTSVRATRRLYLYPSQKEMITNPIGPPYETSRPSLTSIGVRFQPLNQPELSTRV